jgi:hypothetical protein
MTRRHRPTSARRRCRARRTGLALGLRTIAPLDRTLADIAVALPLSSRGSSSVKRWGASPLLGTHLNR